MDIRVVRQNAADNAAAQATLKAEGRKVLAVAADKRTPEQIARLAAIDTELETLTASAVTIATELARAERFADAERQAGTGAVEVGQDRAALRPWGPNVPSGASAQTVTDARRAALGEWAMAVRRASAGEGIDQRLYAVAASGLNSVNPADGGFAIPAEMGAGIERNMFESGQILSRVDARTVSGDAISYLVMDETSRVDGSRQGGVLGYWTDQGTAPTASQFKLARIELKLRKVGALGYVTDELAADAAALGSELEQSFARELTFQVENAIVNGTGAGQPQGILNANCVVSISKETNQAAATIVGPNITKMHARMLPSSHSSSVWLANVDTLPQMAELVQPIGTAGIRYPYASVADNGVISLWGRPVLFVEYCATVGTVGDLVHADLSKYRLIRKASGIEQASSIHVRFTQGEQAFRAFYRVDGQPVPRSAITPFKGSNTLSAFLTLATRS